MTIVLSPEQERFVQEKIDTGAFQSARDVVEAALQIMETQEHEKAEQLEEFRAELDRRIARADQGHTVDGQKFLASLRARSAARRAQQL